MVCLYNNNNNNTHIHVHMKSHICELFNKLHAIRTIVIMPVFNSEDMFTSRHHTYMYMKQRIYSATCLINCPD